MKVKVTRSLFESMVQPLIDRSLEPCRKCIKDAGLTTKEIQEACVVVLWRACNLGLSFLPDFSRW